jgi:hypothetical protein
MTKKINISFLSRFLLITAATLVIHCSTVPNELAGGGTDTEVSGRIYTLTGEPASNTEVILLPTNYNPLDSQNIHYSCVTDDSGKYLFKNINSGTYNIQAVHNTLRTRLLICDIPVDSASAAVVDPDTLKICGSVQVPLPRRSKITSNRIFILGTTIYASGSTPAIHGNHIIIDSIPPGIIPDIVYSVTGADEPLTALAAQTNVSSSDTANTIPCQTWLYSKKIFLNTSATGANTSENVYHFPVLIHLDNSNFVFNDAMPNGSDIRFSIRNIEYLPYEIESWDASAQSADIWVEIDTIHALADSQEIIMHWGNTTGCDWSSSELVFDTSAHYTGVWHLNNPSDLDDATWNQNTGVNFEALTTAGVIGKGLDFNGIHFAQLPAEAFSNITNQITISVWQYGNPELQPQDNYLFLAKSADDKKVLACRLPWKDESILWEAGRLGAHDTVSATADSAGQYEGQWNHWSFVKNATTGTMSVYYNGELWRQASNMTHTMEGIVLFMLGDCIADGNHYGGSMDEFQVSNVERSAAWIKLCFENQRVKQVFIQFEN